MDVVKEDMAEVEVTEEDTGDRSNEEEYVKSEILVQCTDDFFKIKNK